MHVIKLLIAGLTSLLLAVVGVLAFMGGMAVAAVIGIVTTVMGIAAFIFAVIYEHFGLDKPKRRPPPPPR